MKTIREMMNDCFGSALIAAIMMMVACFACGFVQKYEMEHTPTMVRMATFSLADDCDENTSLSYDMNGNRYRAVAFEDCPAEVQEQYKKARAIYAEKGWDSADLTFSGVNLANMEQAKAAPMRHHNK